jgi:Tol biopolymer transport system component
LKGEATPLAERISNVGFSVAGSNVLAYTGGSQYVSTGGARGIVHGQLTWFDRAGKVLGAVGDVGTYRTLALSPDGKRVAFDRADTQNPNVRNIWLYEFARGVTTRFTFDSAVDVDPVWSPDGSRVAFASNRAGAFDLYVKTSNLAGEDELLLKVRESGVPSGWSPDGRLLLYFNPIPPARLWLVPLSGATADRKPFRVDNSEFSEGGGRISPDGRWVAYASDESGRQEIYVRPFATAGAGPSSGGGAPITGKWMVSKDGGTTPIWRGDGKELFYLSAVGGMAMAVDVDTKGVFQAGIPKPLFKVPAGVLFWDVSSDGKRFLMAAPSGASAANQPPYVVVLNWQAELKK